MKLRSIALVTAAFVTAAFASSAAHAQTGVYLTMNAQQFTQEGVDFPAHPGSQNIDRPWIYGPAFGIYHDFSHLGKLKTGPIAFGIDARGDVLRGNIYNSSIERIDGIFSLRVAAKHPFHYSLGTRPYLQGGFGIGHTRNPVRSYYNNNFIYQVGVGIDHSLPGRFKRFDWRVLEVNAGSLKDYPTGYFAYDGGLAPNQSNMLLTVGTGLVYRIR